MLELEEQVELNPALAPLGLEDIEILDLTPNSSLDNISQESIRSRVNSLRDFSVPIGGGQPELTDQEADDELEALLNEINEAISDSSGAGSGQEPVFSGIVRPPAQLPIIPLVPAGGVQ